MAHYFQTNFIMDLIPLIPFQLIEMPRGRNNLFFLVKLIRLYKGFQIFHVPTIMQKIKINYKKRSQEFIKNNPHLANDKITDHNRI